MTFLLNLLIGFSTILVVSAIEDTKLADTFTWILAGAPGNGGCCDSSVLNDCPPGSTPCSKVQPNVNTSSSLGTGSVVVNNFSQLT